MTTVSLAGLLDPERIQKQWETVAIRFIRTVIEIDALLTKVVDDHLQNSVTHDKIVRDSFHGLVKLALGINVIDKKMHDALIFLNEIRNKCAHKKNLDFLLKDLHPLLDVLSASERKKVEDHVDNFYGHFEFALGIFLRRVEAVLK